MKSIKYILALLSALLFSSSLFAQQYMYEKHELLIYGAGGMSSLNYKSDQMDVNKSIGGQFGVGYNLFFTANFGIGIGAELSLYTSKAVMDMLSDKYMTVDRTNEEFEFRSKIYNYQEKQRATYVNIPLMLNYQSSGITRIYFSAGVKIGLPVGGQYKTSGATIVNSGYYAYENVEYTTQEFMGFGSFTGKDTKDDLEFKTAYLAAAELGVKLRLYDRLSLYTGLYFEYGLNDILKSDAPQRFIEYNAVNPSNFRTGSVLTSQFNLNGRQTGFVEKVNLLSIGVKVKLAFGKTNKVRNIKL